MKVPSPQDVTQDAVPTSPRPRRPFVQVVGPRLRPLLLLVLVLFSLLAANSAYLGGVTLLEWYRGQTYQDWFYQIMFLAHLGLGLLLVVPFLVFGTIHLKRAWPRPQPAGRQGGLALFGAGLVVLVSGVLLLRLGVFEIRDPAVRGVAYWAHVAAPLLCAWLFVLHRLAGKAIRWRAGLAIAGLAGLAAAAMVLVQAQDPRAWNVAGPASGEQYFFPSLARTASGDFIPAKTLMMDDYCQECHEDVHDQWSHSVHRLLLVQQSRLPLLRAQDPRVALERDGNVQAAALLRRLSRPGALLQRRLRRSAVRRRQRPDRPGRHHLHRVPRHHPRQQPRGNADYTIEEPHALPLRLQREPAAPVGQPPARQGQAGVPQEDLPQAAAPGGRVLRHLPQGPPPRGAQRLQVAARPEPLRQLTCCAASRATAWRASTTRRRPSPTATAATCRCCRRRTSGRGATTPAGELTVHDHLFPSANTAVPSWRGCRARGWANVPEAGAGRDEDWVTARHRDFNQGVMRVDLFGLREGGEIDGELMAPLRPELPALVPGREYLLETVVRTLKMGHLFTQGTADSNEVWLEVTATQRRGHRPQRGPGPGGRVRRPLVALRQRLRARPRGQPHRPAQRGGHLRPALQPPDPAGRGGRGALSAAGPAGVGRARHRRRHGSTTASSTPPTCARFRGTASSATTCRS